MMKSAYESCKNAANYGNPVGGLHFLRATYVGPEVDRWLEGLPAWMVMSLLRDREDFTLLEQEGQRMFLCLAAEVLFGSNFDAWLREDCYRIATAPV